MGFQGNVAQHLPEHSQGSGWTGKRPGPLATGFKGSPAASPSLRLLLLKRQQLVQGVTLRPQDPIWPPPTLGLLGPIYSRGVLLLSDTCGPGYGFRDWEVKPWVSEVSSARGHVLSSLFVPELTLDTILVGTERELLPPKLEADSPHPKLAGVSLYLPTCAQERGLSEMWVVPPTAQLDTAFVF